jgi:hypothetical protein
VEDEAERGERRACAEENRVASPTVDDVQYPVRSSRARRSRV